MMINYCQMTAQDYDAAVGLWRRCAGMGLSAADEKEPLQSFLERNAGLCLIACEGDVIIATCLCGTDGRRGYLYHLAVDARYRRQGIGQELVDRVFKELCARGIQKCHIMVYHDNKEGLAFWQRTGWVTRPEIVLMSRDIPDIN